MLPWKRSTRQKAKQEFIAEGPEYVKRINHDYLLQNVTRRQPAKIKGGGRASTPFIEKLNSTRYITNHDEFSQDSIPVSSVKITSSSATGTTSTTTRKQRGSRRFPDHDREHDREHDRYNDQNSYSEPRLQPRLPSAAPAFNMQPQTPLQKCLENLTTSIFPKEKRLSSIAESLIEFDHKHKNRHDFELQSGAANILFQRLAFAVYTSASSQLSKRNNSVVDSTKSHFSNAPRFSETDHEVAMICTGLEMIYRASDSAIRRSYEEIGEEILPLLLKVINRPLERIYENNQNIANNSQYLLNSSSDPSYIITKDQKIAIQKVTKVLAAYSLIPSAKYEMAHTPGLVSTLVNIIDTKGSDRMLSNKHAHLNNGANGIRNSVGGIGLLLTEAIRFNAIAVITNLAHADGNKMFMIAQPNLIENISRVASYDHHEVARRCASLAIMNLSNGDEDSIPDISGYEFILDSLVRLMRDEQAETRRNAAISLYNIASSDSNTDALAKHGDGVIVEALVEIVSGLGENTEMWNDKIRSSAAETLFNMTCSRNKHTTIFMANHPSLLEGLSIALKNNSATLDVKMFCAATIRHLAETIQYPMLCFGSLLSALVRGQSWIKTDCIAQGFMTQALHVEHRELMANHHGLLSAISNMSMIDGEENAKIRSCAISTIGMLTSEYQIRPILARHEGIMMALTKATYNDRKDGMNNYQEYLDEETMDLVKGALKELVSIM